MTSCVPQFPHLLALMFVLVGCGDNLTVPQHDDYAAPQPTPLSCVPNLDGRIDSGEIAAAIGVPIRYLVSPAGETRAVDVRGAASDGSSWRWDWSIDRADDQQVVVTPSTIAGKWYAASFSAPDAFVTPFDAAGRLQSVARQDDQALWLLGIASTDPSPPEGQTLMVYQQPVPILRFPITEGNHDVATGVIENATVRGLPYAGNDLYEIDVDGVGTLSLPQLDFSQVHRVRTRVTVSPAVGAPSSRRQVSYFFECFAEVARAMSLPDEEAVEFSTAAEVWRLGFR